MPSEATNRVNRIDARLLRERKRKAQEKRGDESFNSLDAGDQKWVDEADRYMDSKNFDEDYFDKHIEQHQGKYPTNSGKNKNKISARKRALARRVIKKIRKERFDGGAYVLAMFLAIISDVVTIFANIFSAGAANVILVFTTEPILAVILWTHGSSRIELKIKRIAITEIIGIIPGVSLFPIFTISIGYIKMQQDNKVRKLRRILRKLRK